MCAHYYKERRKEMKQYNMVKHQGNRPNQYGKRKHHVQKHQPSVRQQSPQNIFQGNIVKDMRFGGKDHNLSGYVERTVYVKDRHGNVQMAKERQFYNSSKEGMNIEIKDEKHNKR
jgi:hypothetical protein